MNLNLVITILIPLLLGISLAAASIYYFYNNNNILKNERRIIINKKGEKEEKEVPIRGKQVTVGFMVVAVATAFSIPTLSLITTYMEQSPDVYNFVKWTNATNPRIWVDLEYPSPLNVPIKYTIEELDKVIRIKITNPNNFTINSVQLISPQNSVVSTSGNFNETQNNGNMNEFALPVKVFHFDEISNKTYNYSLYIEYIEGPNKLLKQVTIPFVWTIIMKDLPWLNYLWIVMAGVVASRFITFIANTNRGEPIDIDRTESLWIAFTFIIAVIAFASFKENVTLGGIVIFNVLASFAFGFGSQKVLELARVFPGASVSFPGQVTGLKVSRPNLNQVKLEWDSNPEKDIDHYNVYRGNIPGFIIIAQAPLAQSSSNSYTDNTIEPSRAYYYRVSAVNTAGNIGPYSSEQISNTDEHEKPPKHDEHEKPHRQ